MAVEVVRHPEEIWLSAYEGKRSGKEVLRRYYLATFRMSKKDKPIVVTVQVASGQNVAVVTFFPSSKQYVNNQIRTGVLLYLDPKVLK